MYPTRSALACTAMCLSTLLVSPALASFHLWTFSEFFSNDDGSVQFIELHSSGSFETVAAGAQIRTTSGSNVFSFPENLSGNTFNKRLLIATPGFASLPGAVTPDYTLPSTSFFDPSGDTIRLFSPSFGEFHSRTFASAPTDGSTSLNYPPAAGSLADNTPTNFAGATGAVEVSSPSPTGDYNNDGTIDAADYVVWRRTLGENVPEGSGADGDQSGTIGAGDYTYWRERFGNTVASGAIAAPEPGAAAFLIALIAAASALRRRATTP